MADYDQHKMMQQYLSAKQGQDGHESRFQSSGFNRGFNSGGFNSGGGFNRQKDGFQRGDSGFGGGQGKGMDFGGRSDFGRSRQDFGNRDEISMQHRNFLEDLCMAITEKRVSTLEDMYTKEYPKLCDMIHKGGASGKRGKWPSPEEAKQFLGENHNVSILYKELYYRHTFARMDPKQIAVEDRIDSWETYQAIFDKLSKDFASVGQRDSKGDRDSASLLQTLPRSWLWDLLDEFVYQFQQYSVFRAKTLAKKNSQKPGESVNVTDYATMIENPHVFDPNEVNHTLRRLVAETRVESYLSNGLSYRDANGDDAKESMVLLCGYFALIQQIRYHTILGNFDVAVKMSETLDFDLPDPLFYRSASCHCTLIYYLSFSYFSQARYSDCAILLNKTLFFISKLMRFPALHELYASNAKPQEKMWRLLVLCHVFAYDGYKAVLEETIENVVEEKYQADIKILKTFGNLDSDTVQEDNVPAGNVGKVDSVNQPYKMKVLEYFNIIAPKFVSDRDSTAESAVAPGKEQLEAQGLQWENFLKNLEAQKVVPLVRNVLRIYTKVSISKLKDLAHFTTEEETKLALDYVQAKASQLVRVPNEAECQPQRCTDLDFTLDRNGIIHVKIKSSGPSKNAPGSCMSRTTHTYVSEVQNFARLADFFTYNDLDKIATYTHYNLRNSPKLKKLKN